MYTVILSEYLSFVLGNNEKEVKKYVGYEKLLQYTHLMCRKMYY